MSSYIHKNIIQSKRKSPFAAYKKAEEPSELNGYTKVDPPQPARVKQRTDIYKTDNDGGLPTINLWSEEMFTITWRSEKGWVFGFAGKVSGYLKAEYLELTERVIELPEVVIHDTFHLDQVKQLVKENDTAILGGVFHDFEDEKTQHFLHLFNDKEQEEFLKDESLYERVSNLLGWEEFMKATATWPSIALKKKKKNPLKKGESKNQKNNRIKEEPFSFEKEFPVPDAYGFEQLTLLNTYENAYKAYKTYKDNADKKSEFMAEAAKLGFTGKRAEWVFKTKLEQLEKHLFTYVESAAIAFAQQGMEMSERLLDQELVDFTKGKLQPLVQALAATADNYKELMAAKRNFNVNNGVERYSSEIAYNKAIGDWRFMLGRDYPVLMDVNIDLEDLYKKFVLKKQDPEDLRKLLLQTCHNRLENIRKTKEKIKKEPGTIWQLDALLGKTINDLNLNDGIFKTLITEKSEQENSKVTEIVFGSIAFALSVLSVFTGPAAPFLLAASGVIGVGLASEMYKDYELKNNAHNIAHNQAEALTSENPSLFWVAFGLIGAGLDLGGVMAALGAFKPLASQVRFYHQALPMLKDAAKLYDGFEDSFKSILSKADYLRFMRAALRKQFLRVELLTEEIAAMAKEESLFNKYFFEYKELFAKDATTGKLANLKLEEIADRIEQLNKLRLTQPGKVAKEIPELIDKLDHLKLPSDNAVVKGVEILKEYETKLGKVNLAISRVNSQGEKLFDSKKLKKIISNLKNEGIDVKFGKEAENILEEEGARAAYDPNTHGNGKPGTLYFKNNPTETEVVEELLHLGQHRKTKWAKAEPYTMLTWETQAQEILLNFAVKRKWTSAEIEDIRFAKYYWQQQLEKYKNLNNITE